MSETKERYAPGRVRDGILLALQHASGPLSIEEIRQRVNRIVGETSESSVRSYLRLNTPQLFVRESRGVYALADGNGVALQREMPDAPDERGVRFFGNASLYYGDCFDWLTERRPDSIHGVVTDPPYGLHEYTPAQQSKLRRGKGGVWRMPPSYDGHLRSPLPRFTTLTPDQLQALRGFFYTWARLLLPALVPGANVVVASNPLVSYLVSDALAEAGLERRGEIVRLTMTMRGGDRPKDAHEEFSDVSVMPRSMWEPWLVYRKPIEGRVQDNLRKWGTGGFRRIGKDRPFGDVVRAGPAGAAERGLAPHPSLKPQAFLRRIVRAVLPLGEGVVLDTFAGSGATLAAAEAVGYASIGVENDPAYFDMAVDAIPRLAAFSAGGD